MIRVLIVDDHELFRAGIRRILQDDDLIDVVGEAESGEEVLRLVTQLAPDIVLMDLNMPGGMGGIEATRRLVRVAPRSRVLVLTMLGDDPFLDQLREAGALGYLTKGCPARELTRAIRTVADGKPYVDSAMAQAQMMADWQGGKGSPFQGLSSRELQVAMMILDGRRTQEISKSLSLSPKTVSTYRQRIHEKIGVATDVELTRLAMRHGLIEELP
jgi:two-component system, NarL family, invasion response regulator UvrY